MKNNLFHHFFDNSTQISCNFDSDWCNFTPNVYFTRYTGVSPSITSGPTEDRTGDGFYALCNGKLLLDPNEKCLFYQNVSLLVDTDLKFWYHMSGVHIGTLEVILNETNVVWSLTGKQKNEWIQAEIILPAGDYSLAFSANRSIYGRSSCDIALDDLNLKGQPYIKGIFYIDTMICQYYIYLGKLVKNQVNRHYFNQF
ncbi:MAM and LDL-receptor class A domain-containing 2-like [Brachionus plicatilis]|uniref:MAM and LDL-receptor class A domain-containing 2-like n=1 Tax=Brachionus plicatilis TaxID=10195 RepID=A0A3M7PGA0_BRAPC|nr:MAM and LDL-receptor class A domain-containing 2-like [Brachionus plicatilis]